MSSLTPSPVSRTINLRILSSLLQPGPVLQRSQARHSSSRTATRPKSPLNPSPPTPHQFSSTTTTPSSQHQNVPSPTSSVSPSELSHFSLLASSWWDPHGPSRLLHLMNPLRHTFINSCLSSCTRPPTGTNNDNKRTYLDIGCGGGIFAESAARLPSTLSVTAIDPTASVLAVAKAHQRTDPALSPPKLNYLNTSIEDLGEEQQQQQAGKRRRPDMLTLFEVLEHITHPAPFLATCIPHLTPGGWLIGSTIARSPLAYLTTKVIAEAPLIGVVPRGTHEWAQYINPGELRGWFEKRNQEGGERWGEMRFQGVVYLPGWGWRMVDGLEGWGNYFFGVQLLAE